MHPHYYLINSGSVLARNAIPVLHSYAAMLKIAEMEYSGANSIFIRFALTCLATSSPSRYNEISGNLVPEYFSASAKALLALHSTWPNIMARSNVGFRTTILAKH